MPTQTILIIAAAAVIMFLAGFLLMRLRRESTAELPPEVAAMVNDARIDPGERMASMAAEQIESVVQQKLGDYLTKSGTKLDFGDSPDGSLGIWINDTQYTSVDDIPDETIRKAIKEAVQQFNA